MSEIQAHILPGERLHLQHGPIDLIIMVEPVKPDDKDRFFESAYNRFVTILDELVAELPVLRTEWIRNTEPVQSPVACRMTAAVDCFSSFAFITPMAAVAGSVADEILDTLKQTGPLKRAAVNNGGDIAFFLSRDTRFSASVSGLDGASLGVVTLTDADRIGGIATSGRGGRSHTMGIADSVTVLAKTAANADAAATLIANAVDLPGHAAIKRCAACELAPDTDLGNRLVVVSCGYMDIDETEQALDNGAARAQQMVDAGLISSSFLSMRGHARTVGRAENLLNPLTDQTLELQR